MNESVCKMDECVCNVCVGMDEFVCKMDECVIMHVSGLMWYVTTYLINASEWIHICMCRNGYMCVCAAMVVCIHVQQ